MSTPGPPAVRARGYRGAATAVLAAVILLLVGCGTSGAAGRFGFVSPGGATDFFYPPGQRQTIQDISGPDVQSDRTIALTDYAGKVVVLNVWGSWCAPCRAEAPDLNQVAAATADQPVQFLGINVRDTRNGATDFINSFNVPYPSIFDPPLRTVASISGFPTASIPSTIIIDSNQQVAAIFLRAVKARELQATIDAVLAGTTAPSETGTTTAGSAPPTTETP